MKKTIYQNLKIERTMKKSVTINLFGVLYAIDEDAYVLLSGYLTDIRHHFARQEGGEEIADDIERRVAELVAELQTGGVQSVTLEHVEQIIKQIGRPEEVDGNDEKSAAATLGAGSAPAGQSVQMRKKLFRHPDDKLLGGVVAGLACYIGFDSTWLRLLVVLLGVCSWGTAVLVYLVCWVVIPRAVTPEDRLRMQGRLVNLSTLGDEILDVAGRAGVNSDMGRARGLLHSWIEKLLRGVGLLLRMGLYTFLVLLTVFPLLLLLGGMMLLVGGYTSWQIGRFGADDAWFLSFFFGNAVSWGMVASVILLLVLLFVGALHLFLRSIGHGSDWKRSSRNLWWGAVTTFLVTSLLCLACYLPLYHQQADAHRKEVREQREAREEQRQYGLLQQRGWNVVTHEHTEGYVGMRQFFTGRKSAWYIEGRDSSGTGGTMNYAVEKTERVAPGTYTLTAAVRADGDGPEVYACTSKGRVAVAVPVTGFKGGDIWEQAVKQYGDGRQSDEVLRGIVNANDGKGYGWTRVSLRVDVPADSVLRYGVCNRSAAGVWTGKRFSAADFRLDR